MKQALVFILSFRCWQINEIGEEKSLPTSEQY